MDSSTHNQTQQAPSEMEQMLQKFMQTRFYRMLDAALSHRFHHWMLPIIGFLDAVVIFIPTEIFVAVYALKHRERTIKELVGWLIVANSVGYIVNYLIGFYLGVQFYETLAGFFGAESFDSVKQLLAGNIFVICFISALTSWAIVPLTLITFAAGVFGSNLLVLLVAVLLGRAIRFAGIAYVVREYGMKVLERVFRDSTIIVMIVAALLLYWIFLK